MYPHDENWLKKINHIDEVNNRSTMGSSSVPPKSPRNNGKRTRSLSRGAEKQLSSTGGSVNSGKRTPNRSRERESGLNKSGNHTHRSASVPLEPGKEKPASSDTNASSNGLFNFLVNPFEFNSLSVLMSNQDSWRKNPCPETVDFNQFKSVPSRKMQYDAQSRGRILSRTAFVDTPNSNAAATDSIWIIILMIEDEMARASRSQFRLLHPTPKTVVHYLGLYRSARFSDHLIGKWVLSNGMHGPLSGYVPSKFLYTSNTSDSNSKKSASSTNSPTKSPPSKVDSIRTPNNTVKSSAMKQKLMQEVMSSRSNSKNNTDDVGTVNTSGTRRSRKSLIDEAPTRIVVNNKSPNSKCSPGSTAGQSEIHRRGLFAAECANLDTNIDDNNDKSPSRYSGDIIYSPIEKTKKVYSFNGNEDAEFVYEKDESGVTSVESLRKRMEHINLINQDYEMKYTTHTDNVSVGSNTRTKKSGTQKNVQPSFVTNNGRLGTGSAGKFESSFTQAAMSMAEVPHPYRLMPGSDSIKSIKASNQSSAASIGTTSSKGQPQGEDASSGLSISGGRPPSATNSRPSNSAVRNRPTSSGTSNTANYAADTSNSRKKANERNGEVHVSPVNVATGINVVSDNARNQLNRLQIQTNGQSTIRMAYGANPS